MSRFAFSETGGRDADLVYMDVHNALCRALFFWRRQKKEPGIKPGTGGRRNHKPLREPTSETLAGHAQVRNPAILSVLGAGSLSSSLTSLSMATAGVVCLSSDALEASRFRQVM
jgi:hypothetical protein